MPLVPGKKVTNILEIDKVTMLRSIQIHLVTNKKYSPLSTRSREALLFDEEFGSYYAKIIKQTYCTLRHSNYFYTRGNYLIKQNISETRSLNFALKKHAFFLRRKRESTKRGIFLIYLSVATSFVGRTNTRLCTVNESDLRWPHLKAFHEVPDHYQ